MAKKGTELGNSRSAYIAGLFDCFGCIKIEVPKHSDRAALYAWITHKSFKLMELLQSYGAIVAQKQDGQYRAKWKDFNALSLLRACLPHLCVRREQAKVGVEFMDSRKRHPDQNEDVVFRLRLKLLKKSDPTD